MLLMFYVIMCLYWCAFVAF